MLDIRSYGLAWKGRPTASQLERLVYYTTSPQAHIEHDFVEHIPDRDDNTVSGFGLAQEEASISS